MKNKTIIQKVGDTIHRISEFIEIEKSKRSLSNLVVPKVDGLYHDIHANYSPVFVLSTGRCGTNFLDNLFNAHPLLFSNHNPELELGYFGQIVFRNKSQGINTPSIAIDFARYELIRNTFLQQKKYIETNNRITFFAYMLAELYPKAKFIHLVREPISFVASGMSRNWYNSGKLNEEGRLSSNNLHYWQSLQQHQKIAWLWEETNEFVDQFLNSLEESRKMRVLSENLFKADHSLIFNLFQFVDVKPIKESKVKELKLKKVNAGKGYTLSANQIKEIKKITLSEIKYYND